MSPQIRVLRFLAVAGLLTGGCLTLPITALPCQEDSDCPTNYHCGSDAAAGADGGAATATTSTCVSGAPVNQCACGTRICGSLCGVSCGTCPAGDACSTDGTTCIPPPAIGSACKADANCGAGRVCIGATDGIQAPNGYCSQACTGTGSCPDEAICGLDIQGAPVCLASCSSSSACRTSEGYTCTSGVCQACVPDCSGKMCGSDGCGGVCGATPAAGMPACAVVGEVCESGVCAGAFTPETSLPSPYATGLWDARAFDRNAQAVIVGGRTTMMYGISGCSPIGDAALNNVEIYDPTTQTLAVTYPPMPSAIARPHAAFYNGTVYVAGGIHVSAPATPNPATNPCQEDSIDSNFYYFDGTNMNWKTLAAIPEPSMGGGLVAINGTFYLVVGATCPGASCTLQADYMPSADFHTYDPTLDVWDGATVSARPTPRSYVGVISDGIRVYVIGGWGGTAAVGTVEIFDPSMGWTTTTPLPVPTTDPVVAIASNRIFVFGGRQGPSQTAMSVPYVQTIDLTTHATALIGEMPQNQLSGQAPVLITESNTLLLFGAEELDVSMNPLADSTVQTFSVPAP